MLLRLLHAGIQLNNKGEYMIEFITYIIIIIGYIMLAMGSLWAAATLAVYILEKENT